MREDGRAPSVSRGSRSRGGGSSRFVAGWRSSFGSFRRIQRARFRLRWVAEVVVGVHVPLHPHRGPGQNGHTGLLLGSRVGVR